MPSVWSETLDRLDEQLVAKPPSPHQIAALVRARESVSRFVREVDEEARVIALSWWVRELGAIPAPFVCRAFWAWSSPEMPTPREISTIAREQMGVAHSRCAPANAQPAPDPDAPSGPPVTLERRIALLRKSLADGGPSELVAAMLRRAEAELRHREASDG